MFRELVFQISGGTPRVPHFRYLFEHPRITAHLQNIHTTEETIWELGEATGSAEDLADFARFLRREPEAPVVGQDVLEESASEVRFLTKWRRPAAGEDGVSLEYLAYDIAGPDALLFMRVAGGKAEVKAVSSDQERLVRFFDIVKTTLAPRFDVRVLHIGEVRPDWSARRMPAAGSIASNERELLAFAVAQGYYDNPKKCGVRELSEVLGLSKSEIARRLRNVERRAILSVIAVDA